jgi:hypothetical protein
MNTTHDDNATTWRDLADALTPDQVAYLENWESRPDLPPQAAGSAPPAADHARALLFTARQDADQNAAETYFADVEPLVEPGEHYPWESDGEGNWSRFFLSTTRQLGDTRMMISGFQSSDGTITRSIGVDATDTLTADQARELAGMLLEVADEVDRLGYPLFSLGIDSSDGSFGELS